MLTDDAVDAVKLTSSMVPEATANVDAALEEGSGDDVEDDGLETAEGAEGAAKKKKKKKKKKSKKPADVTETAGVAVLSSAQAPALASAVASSKGSKSATTPTEQTDPPTVPVRLLFPRGTYPEGEWQSYAINNDNLWRETAAEKREMDRLQWDMINEVRQAAEVHRQVRKFVQRIAKPGIRLIDMCEQLEDCNRRLVEERGLDAGIAFPSGCSLNHVAAHYTPNSGDNTVLAYDDVMKVDFGTQIGAQQLTIWPCMTCMSSIQAQFPRHL